MLTLITDDIDRIAARLRQAVALREQDDLVKSVVAGFHIEGPFINGAVGYVGAHPAAAVKQATLADMQRLLDASAGLTRLVTLAPEQDPGATVTAYLAGQGIVVSAGHCDASMDQLRRAIDAGLSMYTHLGNGCPAQLPRHDNIVQRVLSLADRLAISFIADGAHIPFFALQNYLKIVPNANVVIVSDTISAGGCGPGQYPLGDQMVNIGEDLVPRATTGPHLVGSACPMMRMAENLRRELGISDDQLRQWMVTNPARLLGDHS